MYLYNQMCIDIEQLPKFNFVDEIVWCVAGYMSHSENQILTISDTRIKYLDHVHTH